MLSFYDYVLFHNDVTKYINQLSTLLLLFVIEYGQINSLLLIYIFVKKEIIVNKLY